MSEQTELRQLQKGNLKMKYKYYFILIRKILCYI